MPRRSPPMLHRPSRFWPSSASSRSSPSGERPPPQGLSTDPARGSLAAHPIRLHKRSWKGGNSLRLLGNERIPNLKIKGDRANNWSSQIVDQTFGATTEHMVCRLVIAPCSSPGLQRFLVRKVSVQKEFRGRHTRTLGHSRLAALWNTAPSV